MNPQEKRQEVRNKIIAACPEIMELKFGCQVEKRSGKICAVFESHSEYRYGIVSGALWPDSLSGELYSKESLGKILGSPITLSHALRAVEKKNRKGLVSPNLKRNSELSEMTSILDWWDFTKNYDDQSDELVAYLYDVLR